jgi:prophage antirepressor-like protein
MNSEFLVFDFSGQSVTAFQDEKGIDWFRGTDVCKALRISNPSVMINRVASEYSQEIQIGSGRPALYVSEPGLYALIFSSKSLEAKKFQRWVFEEVLPKLRSQGCYIAQTDAETLARLKAEVSELESQLETEQAKTYHMVNFIENELGQAKTQAKIDWQCESSGMLALFTQSTLTLY